MSRYSIDVIELLIHNLTRLNALREVFNICYSIILRLHYYPCGFEIEIYIYIYIFFIHYSFNRFIF